MGCGASNKQKQSDDIIEGSAPEKQIETTHSAAMTASTTLTWDVLEKQDDVATKASLDFFGSNEVFQKLAKDETKDILDRDEKDAESLKKGIKFAQDKGVLPSLDPAPYTQIDVLGKSADEVAGEMIKGLGESATKGGVLVLVGLSGTGKGTTVDKLKQKLSKAVTWSNGNLFRCLTKLSCDYADKEGINWEDKDAMLEKVLTASNLKSFMERLKFGKFKNDTWDVELTNLDDTKIYVSEVANTVLKEPRISKTIPTVAQTTQGEVVLFAADACTKMGQDGSVVIVEGREDTVNFIPTPYRFCLTLSDTTIIGARRAAQRVVGCALKDKKESVEQSLNEALKTCTA